jgi:hypothetical protein
LWFTLRGLRLGRGPLWGGSGRPIHLASASSNGEICVVCKIVICVPFTQNGQIPGQINHLANWHNNECTSARHVLRGFAGFHGLFIDCIAGNILMKIK